MEEGHGTGNDLIRTKADCNRLLYQSDEDQICGDSEERRAGQTDKDCKVKVIGIFH